MYLLENKGITLLLFSEATHMNDLELKEGLREIFITQKELVKQIIIQGIEEGIWSKSIDPEEISSLYMGIPVSMNMEMILNPEFEKRDKFCNGMIKLIKKILVT
jgi:hypothetical protein